MEINEKVVLKTLKTLLLELIDGPPGMSCWILNHDSAGLIVTLKQLAVETACKKPTPQRKSIAAHAQHVLYSLELLNRWAAGEPNVFQTADWAAAWTDDQLAQEEWYTITRDLEIKAHSWMRRMQEPREWDELAFTGTIASVAHVAYHLGAINQIANDVDPDSE